MRVCKRQMKGKIVFALLLAMLVTLVWPVSSYADELGDGTAADTVEKDAENGSDEAVDAGDDTVPETEDEPEIYRLAVVTSGAETELRMRTLAPFTLTFDCKPQRYLKSGERAAALTASGARLVNPGMEARPLITVYGSGAGTLTAGGRTVQLKSLDGWLTLDCDLQNAYKGTQNKNNTIFAPEFPVLPPGESAVTWTGGVTRVEIIPRWWTL